jgi:hypothetical protein
MEEVRECKTCKEKLPLNKENFNRNGWHKGTQLFRYICITCRREERAYYRILKKAKKEQEEKDKWKDGLKNKIFICSVCKEDKTFGEMCMQNTEKRVSSICKDCKSKKNKEYIPNYKVNVFKKVIKEREMKKGGNENVSGNTGR